MAAGASVSAGASVAQVPQWQPEQQLSLAPHRQKEAWRSKPAGLPKTITRISYSFLFLLYRLENGFDTGLGFCFLNLDLVNLLKLEYGREK